MTKYKENFFDKKTSKDFFKILLPAMIATFIYSAYAMTDTIFASQGIDAANGNNYATASMGYNTAFTILPIALGTLLGVGISSNMNKELHSGNKDKAQEMVNYFFSLSLLFSIPLMILAVSIPGSFVALGSGFQPLEQEVVTNSENYIMIVGLLGTFPMIIVGVTDVIIMNQNKATQSMLFSLSGLTINIILNVVFVVVLEWGIIGLAIATSIAQIPVVIFQIIYLWKYAPFKINAFNFKIKKDSFKSIMKNGTSASLGTIYHFVLILSFTMFIGIFSSTAEDRTLYTAAFTIIYMIFQLVILFPIVIGSASQQLIIKGYYENKKPSVLTTVNLEVIVHTMIMFIFLMITFLDPEFLLGIFSSDENVMEVASSALPIFLSTIFFGGLVYLMVPFLTATNSAHYGTITMIFFSIITFISVGVFGWMLQDTSILVYSTIFINLSTFIVASSFTFYSIKNKSGLLTKEAEALSEKANTSKKPKEIINKKAITQPIEKKVENKLPIKKEVKNLKEKQPLKKPPTKKTITKKPQSKSSTKK